MGTTNTDGHEVERAYRIFRWICIALTAALLATALLARRAPTTSASLVAAASAAGADPPQLQARHPRSTTDALLNNALDDDQPQRWIELSTELVCSEGSLALVDGEPMRIGERVPATSFLLEFRLDNACPLGVEGPRLSGVVQMFVVPDDDAGLVPVVLASPV